MSNTIIPGRPQRPIVIDAGGRIPAGGATGQALVKIANTDFATGWADVEGGGGGASTWDDITGKPSTFPPSAHTHPASEISDSTAAGRSMLTAANAAAQRALLNVADGATANASDASLRDRATHTGTQLASTISNFAAAVAAEIPQVVSVNSQGGAYTLVLADVGKYVRMTSGSAVNLTVPTNASVAFPVGTIIQIRQAGAGQVTVVASGGVTVNTPETLKLRKNGSTAALVKISTDGWDLTGDLEAV
jgi:hypothetical protein